MNYAPLYLYPLITPVVIYGFIFFHDWHKEYKKRKEAKMIADHTLKNIDELQAFIEIIKKMNLSTYRKQDLIEHIKYSIDGMKRDFIEELGKEAFNQLKETSK